MSIERQILFWGILLGALGYALNLLGSTVAPFAAGIALGYLLDPLVGKLEKLGLNRLGAALIILVAFAATFALVLIVVAPILGNQLINFAQKLPGYAMGLQSLALTEGVTLIQKYLGRWIDTLGLGEQLSSGQIQKSIGDFVAQGAQWLVNALRGLVSGGAAVFNFFSVLIITPVVAFYILIDWERMIAEIDSWLPLDHRDSLRKIAREIDGALAGFIRGQSLVCLFLGLWYGIGLTLVGLDFGFLIGVIAGVLSFVPYVGSLIALVLSIAVSLVQGWPSLKLFFMALGVVVRGAVSRGQRHFAKAGRGIGRAAPGLVDVRPPGLRPAFRLRRPRHRGADRRRHRGGHAPSDRALPQEPVLSRPGGQGTMTEPRQLTLDWPHQPSFAAEDFLPAPSNRDALGAINRWPNWPSRMLLLIGPEGSGQKPPRRAVGAESRGDRSCGGQARRTRTSRPAPNARRS